MRLKTVNSSGNIRVTLPKIFCDEFKLTAAEGEHINIIVHEIIRKTNDVEDIENVVDMTPRTMSDSFKLKKQL